MTHPAPVIDEQLDAAIRSVFADIVAAADKPALTTTVGERSVGTSRRWLAVAAAVLLFVGTAGLILAGWQRDAAPVADIVSGTAPMPSSVAVPPGAAPTAEPSSSTVAVPEREILLWERAGDVGTIERSSVESIVANAHGFVATGMGFDDGRNQGRVWHSADGLSWSEPAFDVFDTKAVFGSAASDDAFFVLAATNADRTPQNEGEGTGTLDDVQIYRSADGITWLPWGEPDSSIMGIATSGNHLLRQTAPNRLEWSTDGDTWMISEFPDGGNDITLLDVNASGLIAGDVTYLRGFRGDTNTFAIWASRDDGRSWTELPTPPAGGFVVETPTGLLINYNPDEQRCNQGINDTFAEEYQTTDPGPDSGDVLDDALWNCATKLGTVRFDAETNSWNVIEAAGPGPTPSLTPIARIGNTLVTAILEPNKALTVWTASLDATDWEPDPTTTLEFIDNTGSPGPGPIAATDQRIVIASPDRIVDGSTVLLVGTPA